MQKINEKVEYGWLQISDLHIFKPETSNNPTYIRKNGMLF